jgi:hypothetical protein
MLEVRHFRSVNCEERLTTIPSELRTVPKWSAESRLRSRSDLTSYAAQFTAHLASIVSRLSLLLVPLTELSSHVHMIE